MQKEMHIKFATEQFPVFMGNFEKILKENNGGDGFIVGSEVRPMPLSLCYVNPETLVPQSIMRIICVQEDVSI